MIKKLRRKFIVIIMTLVGIVLLSVLGSSYVSAWQTQHAIIDQALQRGARDERPYMPRITIPTKGQRPDGPGSANVIVVAVDLDDDGAWITSNEDLLSFDYDALLQIVEHAFMSDVDYEWDDTSHIAWQRFELPDGGWRVMVADTSATDITLRTLAIQDVAIVLVAMGAMLIISIGLSNWALKPVETAWEQQRRFVADASHELKTPLAVIIANTQILERDESLSEESRRWVRSTADESLHMKSLVEELLELARTDESTAGAEGVMHREEVDFSSMVENASLEFDAIAYERGCAIDEQIEENVRVLGDVDWLERLSKILIDNACKYAETGSTIVVNLTRDGKRCTLKVTNHGNTIDPEDLPHVFDRFYRTDKARSRDSAASGFGLGLAIAKGIATSHGGDITCTSDAVEGTTFCASLPALT